MNEITYFMLISHYISPDILYMTKYETLPLIKLETKKQTNNSWIDWLKQQL